MAQDIPGHLMTMLYEPIIFIIYMEYPQLYIYIYIHIFAVYTAYSDN